MTDGITYEPTREHWTPYEPWMRDVLADDARVSWIDRVSRRVTRASWRDGAKRDGDEANKTDDLRIHPDDVPERPTEDIAYRAHHAATRHLQDLTEAMWAEDDGADVDWTELGATAPYDGCDDCVVREIATAVLTELEAGGAIQILNPDTERAEGTDHADT